MSGDPDFHDQREADKRRARRARNDPVTRVLTVGQWPVVEAVSTASKEWHERRLKACQCSLAAVEESRSRYLVDRETAIRDALQAGMPVAAIGRATGLSRQRIYQLRDKT